MLGISPRKGNADWRQFKMSASSGCSERIRVGVIGCGPITLNAHADAIAKAANIELEAIADRDEVLLTEMTHRLRPARAYRDGGDLLNDPRVELVVIAVHDRFHVPLARKALAAGKHVLVEKPLGISVEECEGLRDSLANDRMLAVGCNRQFLPGGRATKRFLLEEGGEVISYRDVPAGALRLSGPHGQARDRSVHCPNLGKNDFGSRSCCAHHKNEDE